MLPLRLSPLSLEQIEALDHLYRTTRFKRVRERAQMILLAGEQAMLAHQIGRIVRRDEQTVRRWLKRYEAEGLEALFDAPRPGRNVKVTPAYRLRLLEIVRLRPRSLDLPFSLWTLERLAEVMAEETSIRVTNQTVRRVLKANGIVFSRPQHTITSPDPAYKLKKRRLKTTETP